MLTMCTINISETLSKVASINLCLLINSTYLAVSIAFVTVYFLSISFLASNLTFTFVKMKKDILKTTFILVLANRKISSKNQTLLRLP